MHHVTNLYNGFRIVKLSSEHTCKPRILVPASFWMRGDPATAALNEFSVTPYSSRYAFVHHSLANSFFIYCLLL